METMFVFMQGLGVQEILVIGLFIFLFFGAKKIPEFMKGLGKGVKEFKSGMDERSNEAEAKPKEE